MLKGSKAAAGVAWSMSGAAGQAIAQLVVFVVLARVLTPEVFGVVAIASALIDILNIIGRAGLVEVLVHRSEVNDRDLNSGFCASFIIGAVLTLALFASAPLLASSFDAPELDHVVKWLSPVCLLFSIGAVYEAVMRRNFQFKQLALRNATATLVSGVVAIGMALEGYGVYALVAQRLILTVWALLAMAWSSGWLPSTNIDVDDMMAQTRQGFSIVLSSILGTGNQRLVDLIVGYFLGAVQLGYLRIAWRVLDLIIEIAVRPVSNVMLTTLTNARVAGRPMGEEYISIIRYASVFIIPLFLGFSSVSHEAITTIFGAKWERSADLLSILSFSGLLVPLIYFKSSLLIASSRFNHVVYLNSIEFLISLGIVAAFAPFGLTSAAIGNVVRTAVATPIILFYLQRLLHVSGWRSMKVSMPAIAASLGMVLAVYVAKSLLSAHVNAYAGLVIYVSVGAAMFLALLLLLDRHLLTDLRNIRAHGRIAT